MSLYQGAALVSEAYEASPALSSYSKGALTNCKPRGVMCLEY